MIIIYNNNNNNVKNGFFSTIGMNDAQPKNNFFLKNSTMTTTTEPQSLLDLSTPFKPSLALNAQNDVDVLLANSPTPGESFQSPADNQNNTNIVAPSSDSIIESQNNDNVPPPSYDESSNVEQKVAEVAEEEKSVVEEESFGNNEKIESAPVVNATILPVTNAAPVVDSNASVQSSNDAIDQPKELENSNNNNQSNKQLRQQLSEAS